MKRKMFLRSVIVSCAICLLSAPAFAFTMQVTETGNWEDDGSGGIFLDSVNFDVLFTAEKNSDGDIERLLGFAVANPEPTGVTVISGWTGGVADSIADWAKGYDADFVLPGYSWMTGSGWYFDALTAVGPSAGDKTGIYQYELTGFVGDLAGDGGSPFVFVYETIPSGASTGVKSFGIDTTVSPVPEPGTILLLGTGIVGIAGIRRKRRSV